MIAKVYATKALLQTAINVYQIQGGRSVHTDEKRKLVQTNGEDAVAKAEALIENFVGENMHEFTIATVYEGPNPVLADLHIGLPDRRAIARKWEGHGHLAAHPPTFSLFSIKLPHLHVGRESLTDFVRPDCGPKLSRWAECKPTLYLRSPAFAFPANRADQNHPGLYPKPFGKTLRRRDQDARKRLASSAFACS